MTLKHSAKLALIATLLVSAACTVQQTDIPPLTGPSELAQSLRMTAIPDSISQDGASQSAITVTVFGPDGKPMSGVVLRMDMSSGGVLQDFGQLNARTIVTGSDGRATAVYTAPPAAPPNAGGSGSIVTIVATPSGSNFQSGSSQTVDIRLVPTGVILPPAATPTADFEVAPASPEAGLPATFNAQASCAGPRTGTPPTCPASSGSIVNYSWNFGDGASGSGMLETHTFASSRTYGVTLTVTNDRGVSASTTKAVTVGLGSAPSGDFTISPSAPVVGQNVFFNASGVTAGAGHSIVQYRWDFGDGATGTGVTTSHPYTVASGYTVVLTVVDDAGQTETLTKTVTVSAGNPTAAFTLTKAGGLNITVNGSASSATGTSTITSYTWSWGDGSGNSTGVTQAHGYPAPGTYSVTLTVLDSVGRQNTSAPQTVTVP